MNLRLVDPRVIRTDQPNPEAWRVLKPLFPACSVMSLRQDGEDGGYSLDEEREAVLAAGYTEFVNLPLGELPFDKPTLPQVQQALMSLQFGGNWIVHCRRGCDRTGLIIACYRMVANGWSKQAAMDEARTCGMSRLEFAMHEFLEHFDPAAK